MSVFVIEVMPWEGRALPMTRLNLKAYLAFLQHSFLPSQPSWFLQHSFF